MAYQPVLVGVEIIEDLAKDFISLVKSFQKVVSFTEHNLELFLGKIALSLNLIVVEPLEGDIGCVRKDERSLH